jgi:cell division protein FtsB
MKSFRRKAKPPEKKSGLREILKKASRKKRFKHILIIAIFLFLLIFMGSGSRGTYKLLQFSGQVHQLEQDIQLLEEQKKQLEEVKYKLEKDSTYLEKVAREKYKMKKKGEKVYEIIEE